MPSEVRPKKNIIEKLDRVQNAQFLGLKPGVKGGRTPAPPRIR